MSIHPIPSYTLNELPKQLALQFAQAMKTCNSKMLIPNINTTLYKCIMDQFKASDSTIQKAAQAIFNSELFPNAAIPEPPLQYIAQAVNDLSETTIGAANTILTTHTEDSVTNSLSSFTASLISTAFKNPLFFLPIISCFLLGLYYSKKKTYINHICLNISASYERKIYEISLIKNKTTITTAFEVTAGQPLRLLPDSNAETYDHSKLVTSYNSNSTGFKTSALRQKSYTTLNIIVNEPFHNESLKNKPVSYSAHFSDTGIIDITHITHVPDCSSNNRIKKNQKFEVLIDSISRPIIREIIVDLKPSNITGKQTLHIPLLSAKDSEGSSGTEYLHIEQR